MFLNFIPFTWLPAPVRIRLAGHLSDWISRIEGCLPAQFLLRRQAKALAKDAVCLQPNYGTPVASDAVSSLGGRPSLPVGTTWPVGKNGKPMHFIAQINYADMPELDGYPTHGLLVVFVENDELWGLNFEDPKSSLFRAFYLEDTAELQRLEVPANELKGRSVFSDDLLLNGVLLEGGRATGLPTETSVAAEELLRGANDRNVDRLGEWLCGKRPAELYYGGYPDFVQWDFRSPEQARHIERVVLQVGSFFAPGDVAKARWDVCWGDAGEMTLLMSDEDLRRSAFDNSYYYWDCS